MLALYLALAPCLLATGQTAILEVGLTSETRVSSGTVYDEEMVPRAALDLKDKTADLQLNYAPRLLLSSAADTSIYHQGALLGGWNVSRQLRLHTSESLGMGTTRLSPIAQALNNQPLQPTPDTGNDTITYLNGSAALGLDWTALPNWRLSTTASYLVNGGNDAQAQRVMPLQHTVQLELNSTFAPSRLDTLSTQLMGTRVKFSNSNLIYTSQLLQSWRRSLFRQTELQLGLGLQGLRVENDRPEAKYLVYPMAEAGLTQRLPSNPDQWTLSAQTRLVPYVDRLTADAYQRFEAALGADWAIVRSFRLTAYQSGGISLDGKNWVTALEIRSTYQVSSDLQLAVGTRQAWQRTRTQDNQSFSSRQWGVFLSANFAQRLTMSTTGDIRTAGGLSSGAP